MVNAQEWLENYLKIENKDKENELYIGTYNEKEKLEGSLKIEGLGNLGIVNIENNNVTSLTVSNCSKLRQIICTNNRITNLNIVNCPSISSLRCSDNKIINLDFLENLNSENLTELRISDNRFPACNLDCFSKFTNIQELFIVDNSFFGSLEPLQNLKELNYLGISNTDIEEGLEYLPKNLWSIWCLTDDKPQSKVKKIQDVLSPYGYDYNEACYYRKWRENNSTLLEKSAQDWLDKNYSKDQRGNVVELDISKNNEELKGNFDLRDFINLERLSCRNNKLSRLNIKGLEKLRSVDLSDNDFAKQDLSIFSSLVNLEELNISNDDKSRIDRGIYNRFGGSLEPLQRLNNLQTLNISGTDIDSGLEYLPTEHLYQLHCSSYNRESSLVARIEKILAGDGYADNIKKWKDTYFQVKQEINQLKSQIVVKQKEIEENSSSENLKQEKKELEVKLASLEGGLLEFSGHVKEVEASDAQEWLDRKHKDIYRELKAKLDGLLKVKEFSKLEKLDLSYGNVTSLHIENCPNLTEINCSYNNLEELKITNCPKLAKLDFWGCGLTDFNFSSLNPESLIQLQIGDNNLSPRDVSCLAPFVNLEWARIGTMTWHSQEYEKAEDIRNHFYGSLEAFKNMKNLRTLNITDTDIDSGLEFLPKSLQDFDCHSNNDELFKVIKLERVLEAYGGKVKKWKVANSSDALEDLQEELEEKEELSTNEAEEWVSISSKLGDVNFATFLREKGLKVSEILSYNDREIEKWRKEYISNLTFSDDEEDEFGSRFRMLRLEEDEQTYELDNLQGSQQEATNEAVIEIRKL